MTIHNLVAAIDRHGMGDHVMFWSEHVDFLKQIADLRPSWILMPEAFNAPITDQQVTNGSAVQAFNTPGPFTISICFPVDVLRL